MKEKGTKNMYCFLDESCSERVFSLGGVLLEQDDFPIIQEDWLNLKKDWNLSENDFIKWSLGEKGKEKKIKKIIKKTFQDERDWLSTFRSKVLEKISSFNVILLASLHQDVRPKQKINKESTVDFYIEAFKFVLQRIWWDLKDDGVISNIFVILDSPPYSKKNTKELCNVYQNAYFNGFSFENSPIPPLKDYNFFESPLITKCDFSSFIQIADFCVGPIRERGKDLLNGKRGTQSKEFLKILLPNFTKQIKTM